MLSTYAQTLLDSYDYSSTLRQRDFPTIENFPGLAAILPMLTTWLSQVQPILEAAAQASSFPCSVSYGQVEGLVTQGKGIAAQIDALSPAPTVLSGEVWDAVTALNSLLLYPELLST